MESWRLKKFPNTWPERLSRPEKSKKIACTTLVAVLNSPLFLKED
jgi:hypothetical protein